MNDFTKEELEDICYAVFNFYKEGYELPSQKTGALYKKIQSMIDNYCEHPEPYHLTYGATILDYCDKCKHIFKFIEG